jgi:hypothetical protein
MNSELDQQPLNHTPTPTASEIKAASIVEQADALIRANPLADYPARDAEYGQLSHGVEFSEEFTTKFHPCAAGLPEFPMATVVAHLDGEPDPEPEQIGDSSALDAVELIRRLFDWMAATRAADRRGLSPIATRTLAAEWVIAPSHFGDVSGHEVAKSFGISQQKFSEHAAEFSRKFGIRNHFQEHDAKNKPSGFRPLPLQEKNHANLSPESQN